jgi:hypothetical protein
MSHPLARKEAAFLGLIRYAPSRIALLSSLALLVLCTLFPVWKLLPDIELRPAIPLHYNIHSGIDLFGPWWNIFLIPALGAVILLVNTVGALVVWKRERMLALVFLGATVLAESLLFFAMLFVVLLNLSYA